MTPAFGALRAGVVGLLAIEVLDELTFGAREAAWPLIRGDLSLSYAEIGVLLAAPMYASAVLEPLIGVFGDTQWRRTLIAAGGIAFGGAALAVATADGFWALLAALVVLYPAAGAFVSLSQATLMDLEPERREQNMARWSVAGGIGAVAGPLGLAGLVALGLGWRVAFVALAVAAIALTATGLWRGRQGTGWPTRTRFGAALGALRRGEVVRWLVLLELADLMLDVLLGFLALYVVDEVGASTAAGGVAVAVWTGAGLVGGIGIVYLLRRVSGLRYLRVSAIAALGLYAGFLLIPGLEGKLVALGLLGLASAGWYSIPKARLYASLPGQSGAAMSLGSITGTLGGVAPLVIGFVAERYGLGTAMWLLAVGPVALLVCVPNRDPAA